MRDGIYYVICVFTDICILSLYVFGSLTRISFSKAACVPYCGLRDTQSRTQHVLLFLRRFLTDAAAIIVHAAATTTSSDIIISCLHCYSFPAYFQSRDYCDADTVELQSTTSRLGRLGRFRRPHGRRNRSRFCRQCVRGISLSIIRPYGEYSPTENISKRCNIHCPTAELQIIHLGLHNRQCPSAISESLVIVVASVTFSFEVHNAD